MLHTLSTYASHPSEVAALEGELSSLGSHVALHSHWAQSAWPNSLLAKLFSEAAKKLSPGHDENSERRHHDLVANRAQQKRPLRVASAQRTTRVLREAHAKVLSQDYV